MLTNRISLATQNWESFLNSTGVQVWSGSETFQNVLWYLHRGTSVFPLGHSFAHPFPSLSSGPRGCTGPALCPSLLRTDAMWGISLPRVTSCAIKPDCSLARRPAVPEAVPRTFLQAMWGCAHCQEKAFPSVQAGNLTKGQPGMKLQKHLLRACTSAIPVTVPDSSKLTRPWTAPLLAVSVQQSQRRRLMGKELLFSDFWKSTTGNGEKTAILQVNNNAAWGLF